ncbi:MAG TPA: cytochrome c [Gammaproteobacteria bacterium]|nr:cytochrome c [Gammaproteobacteria bacterium]
MTRTRSLRARYALVAASLAFAFAAHAQDLGKPDGKAVFTKWCAPCHGDGPGKPGTAALQALYKGAKPALLEQRTDLVPEITKTFVRNGVSVMPFFRKTEISDAELDALAAYLAHK